MIWFLDILREDLSTSLVLQLQSVSRHVLCLHEIGDENAVKVVRHGQVNVESVELQVDLVVDGGL